MKQLWSLSQSRSKSVSDTRSTHPHDGLLPVSWMVLNGQRFAASSPDITFLFVELNGALGNIDPMTIMSNVF